MKQHLRVVAEVAVLGTLALSVALFAPFAWIPVFNFFGSFGIDLSFLDRIGLVVWYAFPFAAAFYYGYRRKLALHFAAVWIGWGVSLFGYGAVVQIAFLRHARIPPQKPLTSSLLWNWLIWLGLVLLPTLLMALATMWGQRRRLRVR